jgi:hypothetical protein
MITQHAIAITNFFFNQVIGRLILNGLSPLVSSCTEREDSEPEKRILGRPTKAQDAEFHSYTSLKPSKD